MGTIGVPWDYHKNGSDNDYIIGMGTIGVPWDYHKNGSDNDYIMGMNGNNWGSVGLPREWE